MSALSHRGDPVTSHVAAEAVELSGVAGTQRDACLRVVRAHPGLTAAEVAERAGLDRYAANRRLPELRAGGKIANAPDGGMRPDRRICAVLGNVCVTWWPKGEARQQRLF